MSADTTTARHKPLAAARCGPALAGLALGNEEVLVFLGAMLCGGLLQQKWSRSRSDA